MYTAGPANLPDGSSDRENLLEAAMARRHYAADALIEILHAGQQLYGHLSPAILRTIARGLRLPPSRVLGVATFYHLFRFSPRKKHCAVVCLGTACYVAGATELMAALYGGGASASWTIESGRCLSSCGLAPVMICDGAAWPRATPQSLAAHIKEMHDCGNSSAGA
jgi:bidirectional [NiFe] hydrogenase diaphorase subunit